ncbi:hypothetical protein Hypma_014999 [Hypsizygus marmoreus]|uniref:Uncharacterized protein n=1 Tax=Hypsizygus marmoreus TaxID=39966 RepID=A0A369K7S8_HYPMA|nr:hypothetical protein Hypma_014999 [Hypsizygus marmoreus]
MKNVSQPLEENISALITNVVTVRDPTLPRQSAPSNNNHVISKLRANILKVTLWLQPLEIFGTLAKRPIRSILLSDCDWDLL